jgi:DNA-directed RNA polymerase specialized sigma24 family protein
VTADGDLNVFIRGTAARATLEALGAHVRTVAGDVMTADVPASAMDAIAALPEPYRQVILRRYYGDLSCAQVAEGLAVPLGTVTKRLSRAYAMLRVSLGNVHEARQSSEVQR